MSVPQPLPLVETKITSLFAVRQVEPRLEKSVFAHHERQGCCPRGLDCKIFQARTPRDTFLLCQQTPPVFVVPPFSRSVLEVLKKSHSESSIWKWTSGLVMQVHDQLPALPLHLRASRHFDLNHQSIFGQSRWSKPKKSPMAEWKPSDVNFQCLSMSFLYPVGGEVKAQLD